MSRAMKAAIDAETKTTTSHIDPAERIRIVSDFFAALDGELEKIAGVRLDAVAALREQGLSYGRIAAVTGLSKPRVAQLARQAEGSRRSRVTAEE